MIADYFCRSLNNHCFTNQKSETFFLYFFLFYLKFWHLTFYQTKSYTTSANMYVLDLKENYLKKNKKYTQFIHHSSYIFILVEKFVLMKHLFIWANTILLKKIKFSCVQKFSKETKKEEKNIAKTKKTKYFCLWEEKQKKNKTQSNQGFEQSKMTITKQIIINSFLLVF